jgi:hypothetical protein
VGEGGLMSGLLLLFCGICFVVAAHSGSWSKA